MTTGKRKEITNKDLTEAETATKSKMKNARLCDFIIDPHQKIYYVFDLGVWTFRIELIKINREEDQHAKYPRCIKSSGEALSNMETLWLQHFLFLKTLIHWKTWMMQKMTKMIQTAMYWPLTPANYLKVKKKMIHLLPLPEM